MIGSTSTLATIPNPEWLIVLRCVWLTPPSKPAGTLCRLVRTICKRNFCLDYNVNVFILEQVYTAEDLTAYSGGSLHESTDPHQCPKSRSYLHGRPLIYICICAACCCANATLTQCNFSRTLRTTLYECASITGALTDVSNSTANHTCKQRREFLQVHLDLDFWIPHWSTLIWIWEHTWSGVKSAGLIITKPSMLRVWAPLRSACLYPWARSHFA